MPGPPPAVARTRVAVRRALAGLAPGSLVLVACSGGADSLALAAAAAFTVPRLGSRAGAVVVDHRLQPHSGEVAERAAGACRDLGLAPVHLVPVEVPAGDRPGGPEARAREARYAALDAVADREHAAYLLVGHTRDDQAEQVLLGLARGSGVRSLAGMPRARGRVLRPLLDVDRQVTRQACAAQGLVPWDDPHNEDPAYRRVRARRLVAELEEQLGPGIVAGLARSADLLRDDADLLEELAGQAGERLGEPPWPVDALAALPRALRTRLLRSLATGAGAPPGSTFAAHVEAIEALVTDWHGQGPVDLPGGVRVSRRDGRLLAEPHRRVQ
ncbi:MAG TPA: tRNA lysidine(34) synthetase TilS [Segeticoccus sp.]|uniref:tRNA lysidine(34) synthetase TilS n=1 Tax=Segeticoccus sp. TaxID=2706531 RepID=UPI002D80693F|nr:tRNA lysidine(34) synthetase TilS [Segeticoccus sp.]HET8599058.1 tRNA lysidine(34) synthetase TilS [Segeticoccus sp.]